MQVWDPNQPATEPTFLRRPGRGGGWVWALAFSTDGRLAAGATDGIVRVWDLDRPNADLARLNGPSLPLDIGYSESIPAGIRNAVTLRDRHCQWAGRCDQPAEACQVHHTKHKADGGPTSVKDCVLLCWFHHQIVIHRWGWTLVLNPDGTTTAWNKDKTKELHSHGPPVRPG